MYSGTCGPSSINGLPSGPKRTYGNTWISLMIAKHWTPAYLLMLWRKWRDSVQWMEKTCSSNNSSCCFSLTFHTRSRINKVTSRQLARQTWLCLFLGWYDCVPSLSWQIVPFREISWNNPSWRLVIVIAFICYRFCSSSENKLLVPFSF